MWKWRSSQPPFTDVWAYTPHPAGRIPCLSVRVCSINPVNTLNNKQSYKQRLDGHTPPLLPTPKPPGPTTSITLMLIAWLAALTWLHAKFKWTGSPGNEVLQKNYALIWKCAGCKKAANLEGLGGGGRSTSWERRTAKNIFRAQP